MNDYGVDWENLAKEMTGNIIKCEVVSENTTKGIRIYFENGTLNLLGPNWQWHQAILEEA